MQFEDFQIFGILAKIWYGRTFPLESLFSQFRGVDAEKGRGVDAEKVT